MASVVVIWALILIPLIMVFITFGDEIRGWLSEAINSTKGEKLPPAKIWDTGFNVFLVIAVLALALGGLRFLYLLLNGRSGSAQMGIGKWLHIQVTLGQKDDAPKDSKRDEATGGSKNTDVQ